MTDLSESVIKIKPVLKNPAFAMGSFYLYLLTRTGSTRRCTG